MKKKYIKIISFIVFLIIVDQITKFIIVKNFDVNESLIIINNFFDFTYITNTGAAFGILSGSPIFLGILSIIIIWYIVKEINKNIDNKLQIFALSLLLSGSIGNLVDRIFRNYVVDFISFKLFERQMPIFNLADAFITVGVILLIIVIIREEKNDNKNRK